MTSKKNQKNLKEKNHPEHEHSGTILECFLKNVTQNLIDFNTILKAFKKSVDFTYSMNTKIS